jgi:hypothetical protein
VTPEGSLLLDLIRGAEPGTERHSAAVDPERLLELVRAHQVDGLAHSLLGRAGPEAVSRVPREAHDELRLRHAHDLVRNERLLEELGDVTCRLAARGIEALVFKGPWLAFEAYPDPGARRVDDIDLGVHERDYGGAVEVLEAAGYRLLGAPPRNGTEALRRAHYGGQLRFSCMGRRMVELHFRMINLGPPRNEDWVRERAMSLEIPRGRVAVPGPEAMLVHLLLHANQHGYGVLRLLCDVRYGLERTAAILDRDRLVARVRCLRCSASAYHGLLLARELAGADVPADLLAALRPRALRRKLFEAVWRVPSVRRLEGHRRPRRVESPFLYLCEVGGWEDKLRYLGGIARGLPRG